MTSQQRLSLLAELKAERARNKHTRFCEASECNNTSRNCKLSFFNFPSNKDRRWWRKVTPEFWLEKWKQNIALKSTDRKRKFLCSVHFDKEAFTNTFRKRLLPEAVPTFQRPGELSSFYKQHFQGVAQIKKEPLEEDVDSGYTPRDSRNRVESEMPFFAKKFAVKETPPRKSLSMSSLCKNMDPATKSREFGLNCGPVTMKLGDVQASFADGKWIEGSPTASNESSAEELMKALKEKQDENNFLKLKIEILLNMLTEVTSESQMQQQEIEKLKAKLDGHKSETSSEKSRLQHVKKKRTHPQNS